MTRKFEPGDVVQAVIDGRAMRVVDYDTYGNVVCSWIDHQSQRLEQATFAESRLKRVES